METGGGGGGELGEVQKQGATATVKNNHKWGLFKKAALGGAALALAPVLVPPLLLFSALGVALAFPFLILLAVFACTNKVMMYLLSPQVRHEEDYEEEEEEKHELGAAVPFVVSMPGEREIGLEPSSRRIEVVGEEKPEAAEGESAEAEKENKEEKEVEEAKPKKKGKSKKASSGSSRMAG